MSKDELVFLPLGGSGEIGMNLNVYGFGQPTNRKWIMIDCGVMFGDLSTPGIELICADPTFILEEKDNLLGVILTHGHEDHIGAVGLLGPELDCPVYATAFTAKLVEGKLEERGVKLDLRIIDIGARFALGPFDLEFVTLTHSIPEPNGVIIRTPLGTLLHTGDWKIDPEPTLGPETDSATLRAIGDAGVLAMICDSTNVFSKGESGSEMRVKESLTRIIARQAGRVAVTTFASNVARVVSICEAAYAADRSVCLLGRSMLRIVGAAREVGLLPDGVKFVEPEQAGLLPREYVLYLCTGSQGEPRAALSRIAREDHRDLVLSEGDTVIFSSKIIPGNERDIFNLINDLVELGVNVVTEKDEFTHVSGHPNREELRKMYEWVRPTFSIPVHGEARHLEEHADFAVKLGVKKAIAPRNGDLIRLAPGEPEIIDEAPAGRWFLDGDMLMPDGSGPMRERRKLSFAGVVVVALAIDEHERMACVPSVSIIGGPKEAPGIEDLGSVIAEEAENAVMSLSKSKRADDGAVELAVTRAVRNEMTAVWGKRPGVAVLIQRV